MAMAVVVSGLGVAAAFSLVELIALVTNLVWYGKVSGTLVSLALAKRNVWMVIVPPLGGLVVGLMARYGSDKIRGRCSRNSSISRRPSARLCSSPARRPE